MKFLILFIIILLLCLIILFHRVTAWEVIHTNKDNWYYKFLRKYL